MAAESDESPVLRAALIVVAVLVLYVLSIGPVARCTLYPGGGWPAWVDKAYFPLEFFALRSDAVNEALKSYLNFWDQLGRPTE